MRLLWWLLRWLVLGTLLAVGLYFGGPYLLHGAGRYLVTADPPAKADLILVLAGHPFLSVPEAARLYHEGLAPRILLTNPPREPGQEELLRVGLKYPSEQELSRKLLEELRVPRDAILGLQERTPTVPAEAQAVAGFLRSRSERSLIVVTAKAKSTRAQMLLRPALRPSLRLRMHPTPGDPYDPNRWWKEPRDRRLVGEEYVGLLVLWARRAGDFVWGGSSPPQISVR
jgi:uncharacterized SAM-binding protein YcdF (DUF218 family)